jgi:acetyl-CoA carboxylase biotin carboxylase subunit
MKRALYEYKITGVKTSINFLARIMDVPDFIDGQYDTHFIEKNKDLLMTKDIRCDNLCQDIAIIAAYMDYTNKLTKLQPLKTAAKNGNSQWKTYGRKKNLIRI